MYLAYTYFIKNKITGQFYYGSRYRNIKFKRTPIEDFWVYYFTSSTNVTALINEHGKDSFDVSIIMEDMDYDKCYFYEQTMIAIHIGKPLCLNGHCAKTGKFSTAGSTHVTSDITKEKISYAKKGKPGHSTSSETKAKLSAASSGKNNAMYGKPAHNKGIPMSDEQKAKLSAANTGRVRSPETKAKLSAALKGKPAHNKGKKATEETKAKMSAARVAVIARKKQEDLTPL